MRPADIFNNRTFKTREQHKYDIKRIRRRQQGEGPMTSRASRKSDSKKVYPVPLTEREMNYLHRSKHSDGVNSHHYGGSSGLRKSTSRNRRGGENARVSYNDGSYSARLGGHRRTKTIGDRRSAWPETDRSMRKSSNRLNRSTKQDKHLKDKLALDLEKLKRKNGSSSINSGRMRKSAKHGSSTDRSLGRGTNRTISPRDKRRQTAGTLTERSSRREPFMLSMSKNSGTGADRKVSSRGSVSRKKESYSRPRYLLGDKSSSRNPHKAVTDRRHYAGSKSYGNDELRGIIDKNRNNGSLSGRRRMSTDRVSDSRRLDSGSGARSSRRRNNYYGAGKGSLTERGSKASSRNRHRSRSRNNPSSGAISDRAHSRNYSDVVTGKARNIPKFEQTKIIMKRFGKVKGFGVNTHRGCVRNYNEDRVSILLNAQQR